MKVKNAAEASEIVKEFVDKFTSLGFMPTCANNKSGDKWVVEGIVAFRRMSFEIDADTGEILNFCECAKQ